MCATFDDGTSKSHCWKINSLFSLILICGQVDLFIFYFHFIVIFILYFYFYFCHRWRWCLFKKRVVSSRPFSFEKNATNVLCFWCIRIDSNRHYLYFRWIIFFLAYIVNEKMFASHFQRKTWKSRLWLLIQKHKFCTLSLQAPHVVLQVLFFLTTQVFYLGSLMMMMMVVVMMMMIMINGCGQRLIFVWRINSRSFLSTIAFLLFTSPFLGKAKTWHVLVFHNVSVLNLHWGSVTLSKWFFRKF